MPIWGFESLPESQFKIKGKEIMSSLVVTYKQMIDRYVGWRRFIPIMEELAGSKKIPRKPKEVKEKEDTLLAKRAKLMEQVNKIDKELNLLKKPCQHPLEEMYVKEYSWRDTLGNFSGHSDYTIYCGVCRKGLKEMKG